MSKKQGEVVLLIVLVIGLIIAAVMVLKGQGGTATGPGPVPTTTAAKDDDTKGGKNTLSEKMQWVNKARVARAIPEVTGGRDPFKDLAMPAKVDFSSPVSKPEQTPTQQPTQPIPIGGDNMGALPVAAPPAPTPPAVTVQGIIADARSRYAVISVEGQFHTVSVGDTLTNSGWTVSKITPADVTLTKDKHSVQFRLSGGSEK